MKYNRRTRVHSPQTKSTKEYENAPKWWKGAMKADGYQMSESIQCSTPRVYTYATRHLFKNRIHGFTFRETML